MLTNKIFNASALEVAGLSDVRRTMHVLTSNAARSYFVRCTHSHRSVWVAKLTCYKLSVVQTYPAKPTCLTAYKSTIKTRKHQIFSTIILESTEEKQKRSISVY